MWMINPKLLCNKHLLGEHGEIHKHRHNFEKRHKIDKRISPVVQIEPGSMESRHDELAMEMVVRKMNHMSPFIQPDITYLPDEQKYAKVNIENSITDLIDRCPECKKRINGNY